MKTATRILSCGVLLLCACGTERAAESVDDTPPAGLLSDVPLFPFSRPSTIQETTESIEQSYASMLPADTVASWYRRALGDRGWEIVSDARMPDGSVSLHAEREGTPLWVMVSPRPDGGTTYRVVAAAPDSG